MYHFWNYCLLGNNILVYFYSSLILCFCLFFPFNSINIFAQVIFAYTEAVHDKTDIAPIHTDVYVLCQGVQLIHDTTI